MQQSELARDIIKELYIFELEGIKENTIERNIEKVMLKNILLELERV